MSTEMQTLYVKLESNASSLSVAFAGAGASIRVFGNEVTEAERKNAVFRKGLADTALLLGGAMVAGVGLGVKANVELAKSMQNVLTISEQINQGNVGLYSKQIVEMSTRLPQSAKQLADGLYDIVSSGYDGAQAMNILDTSASAASAGLTDTATSARAIVSVLNAYGLSADQATHVSDVMFQTVNKGVITFEQLANEIGMVVPTAAAAHVSFDEVGSAMAAMTLSGLSAGEAAISLNQVFTHLLVPGKNLEAAIRSVGYESGAAMLQTLGLKGTIDKLSQSQGSGAESATHLFRSIQAARGYMALTAADGKNYASTFDAIANRIKVAGAAQRAYQTQSQSDALQWKLIGNQLTAFAMESATLLMPVFHALTQGVHDFTSMLNALPAPLRDAMGILALLGGVVLVLTGSWLRASNAISQFRAGLADLKAGSQVATVALRGMQLALGAVGVLLVAATAIYGAYAAAKQKAKQVTDDFVEALKAEATQGQVGAFAQEVADKINAIAGTISNAGLSVQQAIKGVAGSSDDWAALKGQLEGVAGQTVTTSSTGRGAHLVVAPTHEALAAQAALSALGLLHGAIVQSKKDYAEQVQVMQAATTQTVAQADAYTRLYDELVPAVNGVQKLDDATAAFGKTLSAFADPSSVFQAAMKKGKESLDDFTRTFEQKLADARAYEQNLATLYARGFGDVAEGLQALGPQGADLVNQAAKLAATHQTSELKQLAKDFAQQSHLADPTFQAALHDAFTNLPQILHADSAETVRKLLGLHHIDEAVALLKILRGALTDVQEKKDITLLIQAADKATPTLDKVESQLKRLSAKTFTVSLQAQIVGQGVQGLAPAPGHVSGDGTLAGLTGQLTPSHQRRHGVAAATPRRVGATPVGGGLGGGDVANKLDQLIATNREAAAAMRQQRPMYGDVHVTDGYGGFKKQMERDKRAAGIGGRPQ